jgi:D-aspartate ligase
VTQPVKFGDVSTPVVVVNCKLGALAIMRSLGRLGVPVYGVDEDPRSPAMLSRYCRGRFLFGLDACGPAEFLERLLEVGQRVGTHAILIPTSDETAQFVVDHAEALGERFIFPRNVPEMIARLVSKKGMYEMALQYGVPTPVTLFPQRLEDVTALLPKLTFPVMLKGIYGNRLQSRSRRKMVIVSSPKELLEHYVAMEDPRMPNLMLQEYIPGDDDQIFIFNGYFDQASRCLAGFTGHKIRQFPVHVGCASLGVCRWNEEVARTTIRFMQAIGYRGVLDIGYRYDARDGLYKVLDANPRVGQAFRLFVSENDMDVVRSLYLDLTGQEQFPITPREGRRWLIEDFDLISSFHYFQEGTLSVSGWVRSFKGVEEAAWFSWSDPRPFVNMVGDLLKRIGGWLLKRAGMSTKAGDSERSGQGGNPVPTSGRQAFRMLRWRLLRLERLLARLRKTWQVKRNSSKQVYVGDRVSEYREMWRAVAERIGADFTPFTDDLWELRLNGKKTRILNYKLQFDDPVILETAGRKSLVYRLLSKKGLRVPQHEVFRLDEMDRAQAFLTRHPGGCVVKPASGTSSGLGVTTHVWARHEIRKAAILASLYDSELLIERMIPGESYRLLVLDGELIHATCRRGPHLVGDGVSSVAELIRIENKRLEERGENILPTGRDCRFTLSYQNLSLSSIPSKGRRFLVQSVNDLRQRREEVRTIYNETVTDSICDALKNNAQLVAETLGSRFIGVDLITVDPTVPLEESGGAIIEANTTPGLHHHYDLRREKYPESALRVIEALLRP